MVKYLTGDVAYIERNDFLVIAVAHAHKLPEGKIPEFLEKTAPLAGMIAEADKMMHEGMPHNCIEILAKAAMAGKPYEFFRQKRMSDNADYGAVMKEYGMPIENVETYYAFHPFVLNEMLQAGPDELTEKSIVSLECQKERFPEIDVSRAIENFNRVVESLKSREKCEFLPMFHKAYALFHGQVREYEILLPQLMAFREMTDGKMGALVGMLHAEGAAAALLGEKMARPQCWGVYKISELPCPEIVAVETIESILFPPAQEAPSS